MNLGSALILLHALSTSIFLSLLTVVGKLDPEHAIIVPSTASELLRTLTGGANGDAPSLAIRFSSSFLVRGHVSSLWCGTLFELLMSDAGVDEDDAGESRGVNTSEEPRTDGDDDDDEEATGDRILFSGLLWLLLLLPAFAFAGGERWCVTGLRDEAGDWPSIDISICPVDDKYPEKRSSRIVSWEFEGVLHVERLFISKFMFI